MKTFKFIVTYTNDKRQVEVKARSKEEAIYLLECRSKRALMQIVKIDLEIIL
jgi:hypothetical protein